MNKANLCCLHLGGNNMWLQFSTLEDLIKNEPIVAKALEFDESKMKWRYINQDNYVQSKDWNTIGLSSREDKFVKLVFDRTDDKQLKHAFLVASHYYSSRDGRGGDD